MKETSGSMSPGLAKVLFTYRITPQSTTGSSPAELRPHTRLDLLRPNTAERVERKQEEQKPGHDKKACVQTFRINDVFIKQEFHCWSVADYRSVGSSHISSAVGEREV